MKLNSTIALSLGTALLLLSGCGGSGSIQTNQKSLTPEKKSILPMQETTSVVEAPGFPVLESLGSVIRSLDVNETNTTAQQDVYHVSDGETLHLVADETAMGVTGTVKCYQWFDEDCHKLGDEKTLDYTFNYNPNCDVNGTTRYRIKSVIITENGERYSKKYTVYVHKEGLNGGQAELGPLAQASFILRKLDSNATLYEGSTTQGDGQDVTTAGIIPVPATVLNTLSGGYCLLRVTGGEDVDRNDDLVWDDTPTVNHGTLHAILTAAELQKGNYKVNIFTEAIYQYLSNVQDPGILPEEELKAMMDQLASELIAVDIDGDGTIDYSDILRWNPATDKDKLTVSYERDVLPYVKKILLGNQDLLVTEYVIDQRTEGTKEIAYTYDEHGNKLTETVTEQSDTGTPVITVIHFTNIYDDQGHLVEQKNSADNRVKKWIYDASGTLTERREGIYQNDGTFDVFEYYYYTDGKLASASFDRGESPYTVSYELDQYGNVIKETVHFAGEDYVTEYSYEYDATGHILKKYKNGDLVYEQSWKRL